MQQLLLIHSTTLYAAAFLAGGLMVQVGFCRRHKAGQPWLVGLMAAVMLHSLGAAIETSVHSQQAKIFWSQFEYLGGGPAGLLTLGFVLNYLGLQRRMPVWGWLALSFGPVGIITLAWSNACHHLLWSSFNWSADADTILVYHHGLLFYVFMLYTHVLALVSLGLIWSRRTQSKGVYRRQLKRMFLGILCPELTCLLYVIGITPLNGMDITPVGYLAGAVLLASCLNDYQLLDLVPAARGALVEGMPDGVLVFDEQNRLVDINRAAERFIGLQGAGVIGQPAGELFKIWPALEKLLCAGEGGRIQLHDASNRMLEARTVPLYQDQPGTAGQLMVLRDVTALHNATAEREKLIADLQQALVQVKTLSGLLPICSGCKKIRDDAGYWSQIEVYISQHSEATFTHGLCPECMHKYFPEAEPGSAPKEQPAILQKHT